jgi:hypothetical protein
VSGSGLDPQTLTTEVPAAIKEVSDLTGRQRLYAAEQIADVIACGVDILWAEKVPRNAEVKPDEAIRAITCGLAILAHRPGGVTFGGLHWCTAEHDDCPGPGEWTVPAASLNRSTRGAFFTPRSLAEEVTFYTIEALAYRPGPNQTGDRDRWRLVPSAEILALKVGDISVGAGVFLLAGCRYLADRLVEAWFDEADHPRQDLPPHNPITLAARRQVMRCLYGVDIDPLSVELCRLSLALLAPTVPLDLTRRIVCGDSLLGITSLDQLEAMHLDPEEGRKVQRQRGLRPVIDPELMRLLTRVQAHQNEEAA